VGTVVRVSNHYMVGVVLGILAALVAGAALAFAFPTKQESLLSLMAAADHHGNAAFQFTLATVRPSQPCDAPPTAWRI